MRVNKVLFALILLIAVLTAIGEVRGQSRRTWTYECFFLYKGAVDKLSSLPEDVADTAKLTVHGDAALSYCVVWKR